jgi:hypothetical protein
MKAILYVGGALMVAASIYGFIDYKKSSHDKNFKTLYENKKEAVVPAEKKEIGAAKEEPAKATEVKTNPAADKKPVVVKKKRKVTLKRFSRAPIDEKYLEEKIKVEPKKSTGSGGEETKGEKKEQ